MIRVLIFPAGEINSIELHDALSTCVNVEVWGTSSIERHGKYVFKNYIPSLPLINNKGFIDAFNKILDEYKIDVILATHDTVIRFLKQNEDVIKAKIAGGDLKTVEICRSKKQTYELLKEYDFIPKVYNNVLDVDFFPVFAKPNEGQGAIGTSIINNKSELNMIDENYVICEYLPGKEYTVDCFTDYQGNLLGVYPRTRNRMMAGVCVNGQTLKADKEIFLIAEEINSKLNFKGMWYFQIKEDINNKLKLLEISARASGTMCLTRMRGVNLPLLTVYTMMDMPVKINENNYTVEMDRTLISRYRINYEYKNVYIDFDDTIIISNKVNKIIIRFLYQCYEQGINVYLITKHQYNLIETLEKYAIHTKLFTSIIHINDNENKVDFIQPDEAIFIDNMYKEREQVKNKYNIPVFDVDNVEVLIDWRS